MNASNKLPMSVSTILDAIFQDDFEVVTGNGFKLTKDELAALPMSAVAFLLAYGVKQKFADVVASAKNKGWTVEEQHKRQRDLFEALMSGKFRAEVISRSKYGREDLDEKERKVFDIIAKTGLTPVIKKSGKRFIISATE